MDGGLKLVTRTGALAAGSGRNRATVFDREFAGVPVPCVRLDPRGVVVSANAAAVGLLHLPRAGKAPTLASFVQAPDVPRYIRFLQDAGSSNRLCEATLRLRCGNGRARSVQMHAGATVAEGRGIVLSLIDVTPRVEVAEQLRAAEASIRGLLDALPQPAFVVVGGEVVASNAAAADLVGEDPRDKPMARFVGRGQQEALRCCLDTDWVAGSVQRLDTVFAREGTRALAAETLWLAVSFQGRRATLCLVLTESAAALRETAQADRERLLAIGGMASSLGHSLNNALTCLGITIGELTERALAGPEEVRQADADELIDAVTEGLERIARGVRQLQGIVRLSRGDSRPETEPAARAYRATREIPPTACPDGRATREMPTRGTASESLFVAADHRTPEANRVARGRPTRQIPAAGESSATVDARARVRRARRELPTVDAAGAGPSRAMPTRASPQAFARVQPVTREVPALNERKTTTEGE